MVTTDTFRHEFEAFADSRTPVTHHTQAVGLPAGTDLPAVLAGSVRAHTTGRVDLDRAVDLAVAGAPRVGDLVLARVTSVGQHARVENPYGRKPSIHPGATVVLAYGHRYAPDQFEAVVPDDLGPCHLVAAGGIASRMISKNLRVKNATTIEPLGLLLDAEGRRLSTFDGAWARPVTALHVERPDPCDGPVVLVVTGSGMNAGKTTSAATLCHGLRAAGYRVGAAKVTGSGAGNDTWSFHDHGAHTVVDFTHAGYPSTWRTPVADLVTVFEDSLAHLAADGCEVVVVEFADGVYQEETGALLSHPVILSRTDGILYAATDPLSGTAGVDWLRRNSRDPLAVTGLLSSSVLGTREFTVHADHPVWNTELLSDGAHAGRLVRALREDRADRRPVRHAPGAGR
ncbi:DUF1611 domain-containing protein [Brevibacterium litoralis]|uniref:DUF1611 domain-containing protein n=1 Tax=Brevibacterium litoralis TaxID=3138935 RepID=UPI0032EEC48F